MGALADVVVNAGRWRHEPVLNCSPVLLTSPDACSAIGLIRSGAHMGIDDGEIQRQAEHHDEHESDQQTAR